MGRSKIDGGWFGLEEGSARCECGGMVWLLSGKGGEEGREGGERGGFLISSLL